MILPSTNVAFALNSSAILRAVAGDTALQSTNVKFALFDKHSATLVANGTASDGGRMESRMSTEETRSSRDGLDTRPALVARSSVACDRPSVIVNKGLNNLDWLL